MTETKCFRDAFRDQLHELSEQPNIKLSLRKAQITAKSRVQPLVILPSSLYVLISRLRFGHTDIGVKKKMCRRRCIEKNVKKKSGSFLDKYRCIFVIMLIKHRF